MSSTFFTFSHVFLNVFSKQPIRNVFVTFESAFRAGERLSKCSSESGCDLDAVSDKWGICLNVGLNRGAI